MFRGISLIQEFLVSGIFQKPGNPAGLWPSDGVTPSAPTLGYGNTRKRTRSVVLPILLVARVTVEPKRDLSTLCSVLFDSRKILRRRSHRLAGG